METRGRNGWSWLLAFGAAAMWAIGGGTLGSYAEEGLVPPGSLQIPKRLVFPPIVVTRDPFRVEELVPPLPAVGGDTPSDLVLPPNAAVAGPRLRAVIAGGPPRALIEENGRTRIVGVGSELAGSVVSEISESEVRLEDGETLRLTGLQP
ncbi:MAG TPA: hypothetical protein VFU90_12130 [Candidatus Tumulicola sp.]|nr:hypothetical protein [Candidatus Tumulicola sp.]